MRWGYGQIFFVALFCLAAAASQAQTDSVVQRIILVGDAGEIKNGKHPTLDLVRSLFPNSDKRNTVIYLGDNIYPNGLPDENAKDYAEKKAILDTQINLVKNSAAKAYFIPGNHDWMQGKPGGWRQIFRQSKYVESLELQNIHFIPQNGCPGPVEVQLGDGIVLIAVDSQWWLEQEARPGATSDCDCKSENEVLVALKDMLYRNRDKLVLFAAHHPFRSHGIHGGYYTIRQHIFPFTDINPNLYIPLPVVGSLYPLIRGVFGNIQDLKHPKYKDFISQVDQLLSTHPYCIRVAGHEHSLQWLVNGEQNYIVSGAGSKSTRVKYGSDTKYADAGQGFSVLELLTDGHIRLRFYSDHSKIDTAAYTAKLKIFLSAAPEKDSAFVNRFPDSITTIAASYYKASSFKKWLLGKNYREEWASPVRVKVFDIANEAGGLKPIQRGGGFQSKSLRLEDADGRQYVLRSIEKYPDKVLPEEFRQTFVKDVIVDGISASYPYAALSVPPLAAAAGVPHANPVLRYVPDDPRLGQYRIDFANSLCIFEEREPGEEDKTYSTLKVVEKLQEDNDNKIDQHAVLRARLLDMFIMDFDRHEDQWRWGANENDKGKTYYPIPRDRDQAFFLSDGFIPFFIRQSWIQPKFQGFRPHAININTFNFNARYFDRSFLNELSGKDWDLAVDEFLPLMTDTIIETALRQQPKELSAYAENQIIETLKKRRQYMKQEMLQYYKFLAKEVDIAGSDKKELFEINRNDDGSVNVIIYKVNKDGEKSRKLYERLFLPTETNEIRLYGMGADDKFEINGKTENNTICLRIIGGAGNDIVDNADINTAAVLTKIYDLNTEENKIVGEGNWQSRLSDNPEVNRLDRRAYKYNILAPLISVSYNPDDGVFLGMSLKYTRHAFRKDPHSVVHFFKANYALATGAYNFSYRMDAVDVIGKADVLLFGNLKAPNNTQNFFGLGNETVFPDTGYQKIKYYRSRYNLIESAAMLRFNPTKKLSFLVGPVFQRYWIDEENNTGRFINNTPENGLDSATLYEPKSYAGLQLQINIDGRNNALIPTRGVNWQTYARWVKGTNSVSNDFGQFRTDLSVFTSFRVPANVVIGFRIGGGMNWGNYEFFQAQYLSGTENLRGYRKYRFAGDKMVYNNIDVRIHLADFKGYIFPGSFGLVLFNDIGRVWVKGEESSTWHNGVGGGFWLAPAKRYVATICYAHSKDGGLPFISLGFQF